MKANAGVSGKKVGRVTDGRFLTCFLQMRTITTTITTPSISTTTTTTAEFVLKIVSNSFWTRRQQL